MTVREELRTAAVEPLLAGREEADRLEPEFSGLTLLVVLAAINHFFPVAL